MGKEDKTVFISYRRKVSWSTALLIYQDLEKHGWDVFMDVKSIDSGKFEPIILRQIGARKHFLVILEAGTLDRAVSSSDWLRREIEEAINLKRNVVPLMTENFSLSEAERFLKGDLMKQLPDLNGITLRHEYFNAGMKRLRKRFMKAPSDITIKPPPSSDRQTIDMMNHALLPPKLTAVRTNWHLWPKKDRVKNVVMLSWDEDSIRCELQLSFSPTFDEKVVLYDGNAKSYVDECIEVPRLGQKGLLPETDHTRYYRVRKIYSLKKESWIHELSGTWSSTQSVKYRS